MKMKIGGFTLMEVLIALAILAIAFTGIFMAISHNSRALNYLESKTAANWIGLNIIAAAQLHLIDLSIARNHLSGTENMFTTEWFWSADVSKTADVNVAQIEVAVSKTADSAPLIHLVGYLRNEK